MRAGQAIIAVAMAAPLLTLAVGCVPRAADKAGGPTGGTVESTAARTLLVQDQAQFRAALASVKPGDRLVLADGVWRDFRIDFFARGTAAAPITLAAQTPGKVILSGLSNLRLAGEHLVVTGLVFRDGHTPTGEVIAFRGDKGAVASNSRVTETVIDGYNRPNRGESDHWVALYGQGNRFDRNHVAGKTNQGATLVVVRDPETGLDNRHRIDRNYFGPRPPLGSNGGETIRVGTSHQSRSDSNTVVEYNYFERCDGEVEIVSNKSGGNVFRGNVFVESQGALTLRHGHGNIVEDNVFLGRGKPHTGGIRVINRNQTVRNNYMEGLAGESFASAVAVLNGVPNGPINRYDPVENATIANNTVIEAASIELAAGSDKERTAVPTNSRFTGNLIVNQGKRDLFRIQDDISGIRFEGNVQTPVETPRVTTGIERRPVELRRAENGLLYPVDPALAGVGIARTLKPIGREETGVSWYPKDQARAALGSGRTIVVAPGDGSLSEALRGAGPGDTLALAAGRYAVDEVLAVDKPLSVVGPAAPGAAPTAEISFSRPTLFQIERGGSLRLSRVAVSGGGAPDAAGNAVVRTSGAMGTNYELLIEESRVADLDVNNAFHVVAAAKGTVADRVVVRASRFENVSGAVLKLDAETDDLGLYNAETVEITGSEFRDVRGEVLALYRGGTDESTFGPRLTMRDSVVLASGKGARNASGASIRLHGVQMAQLQGNRFVDSAGIKVAHTVGEPKTEIRGNVFRNSPPPQVEELIARGAARAVVADNSIEPKGR